MEKKNYTVPTISYVGPDLNECLETNAPIAVAVGASVAASVATAVAQRVW